MRRQAVRIDPRPIAILEGSLAAMRRAVAYGRLEFLFEWKM